MADMFDYLTWRGDLSFSQAPPGPVDSLIFTSLCYVDFGDIIPRLPGPTIALEEAVAAFLQDPQCHKKVRVEADLELLAAVTASDRFRNTRLSFYRNVFIPEEDTQFAAMAWHLDDGSVFLSFRGTDYTLVGWKEDFNMSFLDSIPAQRLARQYVLDFAAAYTCPIHLGGHSKGGNLAIYAAAKCPEWLQKRIVLVWNHDGPGFKEQVLQDPGYQRMIPKLRTFVPQSSIFGMMLEHEEPHTIIKSRQIGLLQHDPYTWEVCGKGFVEVEELTADSRFIDRTFKTWLAGMTTAERNEFFDTVFELLMSENAYYPWDVLRPQNVRAYFQNLITDTNTRRIIAAELAHLLQSAKSVQKLP